MYLFCCELSNTLPFWRTHTTLTSTHFILVEGILDFASSVYPLACCGVFSSHWIACHLAHTCVSSKWQDLHCVEQVTFKTTWYSWKQLKCFIGLFHKSKVPQACKGHIFWCREAPLLLPTALAVPNNCSPSQPSCLRPVLCSPCFPISSSWGVSHSPARSVFQRRLLCD